MLLAYGLKDEQLVRLAVNGDLPTDAVWIDLVFPSHDEETRVERLTKVEIPTREEMAEIEVSSRLYRENDTLYMTASLIVKGDAPAPQSCPVSFILTRQRLVTVRYSEPSVFRTFPQQAEKADSDLRSADSVLIGLLEAIIDRTADILERVSAETDAISLGVLQSETGKETMSRDYKAVLRRLGQSGDLNSKARESLVSLGRLVNFLHGECGDLHPELMGRTDIMATDIRSLSDHASYVAGTTTFLLDATLGLINIEQNAIIKIVSVVSVLIMPPTMVGTIYGMNFRYMPELDWRIGYPLALLAMLVSAVLPYLYFRRRGWL
jgi:magnesium transporter